MKVEKVKILFILPALRLGGAEKQVVDLLNNLSTERFEVSLFTFEKDQKLIEKINQEHVRYYNVPKSSFLDLSVTKKIAGIIDSSEIDIIHCTLQISLLYGFIGRLMARRKPKLIDAIHTTINRSRKYDIFDRFLYVPLMHKCDAIISVCNDQKEFWSRKYPSLAGNMQTVHNGIDSLYFLDDTVKEVKLNLKLELGIDDKDIVVGIVAGIRPEKNHGGVIDVAAELMRRGLSVKFLFVGGGLPGQDSYLTSLKEKATRLGVAGSIIWAGATMTPKPYISIFDIGIMFSLTTETFSLSLLEYLSMGKPVVAADIGGTREMIHSGINGYLVPMNDLNAFSDRLADLIQNDQLRLNLAANARELVLSELTVVKMAAKTEKILESVMRSLI
jgi:glycosyltransferase involved in cell wall biosynthesis